MSIRDALDALPQATPGPWKAELCLGGRYVIDNTLPENRGKVRRIAEVYGHLSTPSDARLIASAPEMAEWIMEAVPWLKMAQAVLFARANHATDNGEQHSVAADELRQDCLNQMAKLDQLIQKAVDSRE